MKIEECFRDRQTVEKLAERIDRLSRRASRSMRFMEVCGTHTMSIGRFGIRNLLPANVRLTSGPGCPVCVTAAGFIDRAIACCRLADTVVASFGDMVRVPGSTSSLIEERARGGDVRVVYSPLQSLNIARENLHKRVIFLGIGFETTAPTVAATILAAAKEEIRNYRVLCAHKTMPQAMKLLAEDPALRLDGFLCPPHVSAIIGARPYESICSEKRKGCVVTGFEPLDILQGVEMLIRQVVEGRSEVDIQYSRVVTWEGNRRAREVMDTVFSPVDAEWRGLGVIEGSGLKLREAYRNFDADVLPLPPIAPTKNADCRCGEILTGKREPNQCPLFAVTCTPESPVGACMVSSEGACAAAYKYGR